MTTKFHLSSTGLKPCEATVRAWDALTDYISNAKRRIYIYILKPVSENYTVGFVFQNPMC